MRRRAVQAAERICWVVTIAALGWYAAVHAERLTYQAAAQLTFDRLVERATTGSQRPATAAAPLNRPSSGQLFARFEIPRLGVAAMVRPGTDRRTLRRAIGHIEGTGLPGVAGGNVGLAAHRDTFFRPLRDIRPDDEIRLTTPEGDFVYRVTRTLIVDPDDVWVLDEVGASVLTLVTCYPFDFIGNAPRRFIVRAEQAPTHTRAADAAR